jgi:hypothetical protein
MSKVFISYSHKDKKWKERPAKHLIVVELEGHYTTWDDSKIKAGKDWPREIKTALNEATVAVFLISADFLTSEFIREKEVKPLLERRQKGEVTVIPLILSHCPWKTVKWLSSIQARPFDGKPLNGKPDHEIDADLSSLAEEICSLVSLEPGGSCESPDRISLSRMPVTDAAVFGREKETSMLDEAWNTEQTNVVTLIAWGGVGKTALVNHWLNGMNKDGFRGAEKVYAWSFYSPGAAEGKQASADEFMQETLRWFGDADPTAGMHWR